MIHKQRHLLNDPKRLEKVSFMPLPQLTLAYMKAANSCALQQQHAINNQQVVKVDGRNVRRRLVKAIIHHRKLNAIKEENLEEEEKSTENIEEMGKKIS